MALRCAGESYIDCAHGWLAGDMDQVQSELKVKAGPRAEVMTWKEMMPELVQAIEADSAGGILMLLILYIVIGFGIFGTIMMMTTERSREFGVSFQLV